MLQTPTQLDHYEIARRDFLAIPPEAQPTVRYLSVPDSHLPIMRFVVASFTRSPQVDACGPQQIAPSLWRIDLDALQWASGWESALADYPYSEHRGQALVVRFDWLMDRMIDSTRSSAGELLLWGKRLKSTSELEQLVGLDRSENDDLALRLGHIEGSSGVARQPERIIEINQLLGGFYAQTFDFETIDGANSPVDRLDIDKPEHDASEIIIGQRKFWRGGSGLLQMYALANGKGEIQQEAPIELVEDSTRAGGLPTVRNSISCISCHNTGLLNLSENRLDTLLADGIELYEKEKGQVDRAFLNSFKVTLQRAQEDYQSAMMYLTGLEPEAFSKRYIEAVNAYRRPLDAEQIASEFGVAEEDVIRDIAVYSESYAVPGNVAAIAHGKTITREYFESQYFLLKEIVQ